LEELFNDAHSNERQIHVKSLFWIKGVVFVDLFICGKNLNAECYCGTLKRLRLINSKQNLAQLQRSVIILHDDTRALPLSNFKIFVPIKMQNSGKRLQEDAGLKQTVTSCQQTLDSDFLYATVQTLVQCREDCWNSSNTT
jgi:hypothetical protein